MKIKLLNCSIFNYETEANKLVSEGWKISGNMLNYTRKQEESLYDGYTKLSDAQYILQQFTKEAF